MKFAFPFILLLLLNISVYSQEEYTRETDSLALVDLYNSCDGPNWVNNENWLTGPLNSWYGVGVGNNRVYSLKLNGRSENERQGLKNVLPASIGELTELSSLYLTYNELRGGIPSEIGQLTKLKYLSFYSNKITIIPEEIGNLILLKYLDFSKNEINTKIPIGVTKLIQITNLSISQNQLIGTIPDEICELINLDWLDLHANQLEGSIPDSIGNLQKLNNISLARNKLSGSLPQSINKIAVYHKFWITNNLFDGFPDYSELENVNDLMCQNNKFTFGDIENMLKIRNINMPDSMPPLNYHPQKKFGNLQNKTVFQNNSIMLAVKCSGSANHYQWYKDNILLEDSDSDSLLIKNAIVVDAGEYYCKVTSDVVTDLTLTSEDLTLLVKETNEAPVSVLLDNSTILENSKQGTRIGEFTANDIDNFEHLFSLVNDSMDNQFFRIEGNLLLSNVIFNFEKQNSYSILVKVDDKDGGTLIQEFIISIIDQRIEPGTVHIKINQPEKLKVNLKETIIDKGDTLHLSKILDIEGELGEYSYFWSSPESTFQKDDEYLYVPEKENWVRVTVIDKNNCTAQDSVVIKIAYPVGVNENSLSNLNLVIFPNPNSGNFNYKIRGNSDVELKVLISNAAGSTIQNQTINNFTGDHSGNIVIPAKTGMYHFTVYSTNGSISKAFIVK